MGIKSVETTDRLYWLGRYTERVYTTLKLYGQRFDRMLEEEEGDYDAFCRSLDIPNIYTSSDHFVHTYPFSDTDPNSIKSNLRRAHDNAIELRESIGSDTLAYIQLAVYELNKAADSASPLVEFQRIQDYILAFWGIVDDEIEDEDTRNILKVGKRIERIDLFGRLHVDHIYMEREITRLAGRIDRCSIRYNPAVLHRLKLLARAAEPNHNAIVWEIEQILEV